MAIKYNCTVNYSDHVDPEYGGLDMDLVRKAISGLEHDDYGVYTDETGFEVSGEVDIDPYDESAATVKSDIEYWLRQADIDADVDTEEVEYEPDWDRMPGGYDYF